MVKMFLIIETSTDRGLVAIASGSEILIEERLQGGYQHSHTLLASIDKCFKRLGLTPSAITAVVVGVGPGSYTGMRVGAAAAKCFAYARKVPLIGVSSLQAFVPLQEGLFASVLDARAGGVYFMIGERLADGVSYTTPPDRCSLDQFVERLGAVRRIVTPHKETLSKKEVFSGFEWIEQAPNSQQFAVDAARQLAEGRGSYDGKLELLYLRLTQAEIELSKKKIAG